MKKYHFITRKTAFFIFSSMLVLSVFSCKKAPVSENSEETEPVTEITKEEELPEKAEPAPVIEEIKEEPAVEVKEEEPVIQEPQVEVPPAEEIKEEPPAAEEVPAVPEEVPADDEYSRSVGTVHISRDTFEEDKERVLEIISKLDIVMKDFDYRSWLTYVDKQSIDYWSRPVNLKKAQNRLPVKGLKLSSLQDYFKYVFVPARKGRKVTEIRYISDNYIKAIEVGEEQDIVYYYFNKINGQWMVNLPPIED